MTSSGKVITIQLLCDDEWQSCTELMRQTKISYNGQNYILKKLVSGGFVETKRMELYVGYWIVKDMFRLTKKGKELKNSFEK